VDARQPLCACPPALALSPCSSHCNSPGSSWWCAVASRWPPAPPSQPLPCATEAVGWWGEVGGGGMAGMGPVLMAWPGVGIWGIGGVPGNQLRTRGPPAINGIRHRGAGQSRSGAAGREDAWNKTVTAKRSARTQRLTLDLHPGLAVLHVPESPSASRCVAPFLHWRPSRFLCGQQACSRHKPSQSDSITTAERNGRVDECQVARS